MIILIKVGMLCPAAGNNTFPAKRSWRYLMILVTFADIYDMQDSRKKGGADLCFILLH